MPFLKLPYGTSPQKVSDRRTIPLDKRQSGNICKIYFIRAQSAAHSTYYMTPSAGGGNVMAAASCLVYPLTRLFRSKVIEMVALEWVPKTRYCQASRLHCIKGQSGQMKQNTLTYTLQGSLY